MDPTTTSQDTGAWALSRLGYAIDAYVDRQVNNPQLIQDHSAAYGMDSNGNLYKVGQPAYVQTMSPVAGGAASPTLILLLIAGFLLVKH